METYNYHEVSDEIKRLLVLHNFWFQIFEHEPVRTSEEAVKTRPGYTLEQGAKALITKVKKSRENSNFLMLVMPANLRFDAKKVKILRQSKEIRFATEEEVEKLTNGVKPGGVPPFGNLFGLEVIADDKLFENEKIVFNAGDRSLSIAMNSIDYKELVKPTIASITITEEQ